VSIAHEHVLIARGIDQLKANPKDMPTDLNSWYTKTNNDGKTGTEEVSDKFDRSLGNSGERCGRISSVHYKQYKRSKNIQ